MEEKPKPQELQILEENPKDVFIQRLKMKINEVNSDDDVLKIFEGLPEFPGENSSFITGRSEIRERNREIKEKNAAELKRIRINLQEIRDDTKSIANFIYFLIIYFRFMRHAYKEDSSFNSKLILFEQYAELFEILLEEQQTDEYNKLFKRFMNMMDGEVTELLSKYAEDDFISKIVYDKFIDRLLVFKIMNGNNGNNDINVMFDRFVEPEPREENSLTTFEKKEKVGGGVLTRKKSKRNKRNTRKRFKRK